MAHLKPPPKTLLPLRRTALQVFDRLKAFVTIVEEGSLSAAVKKLHITQPALSARIKLLEEEFGCMLLERTGRGVRPTSIGGLVYNVAKDISERVDSLNLLVKNHLEYREGWVHLMGDSTSISGIFPDVISNFKKQYKDIKFTLRENKISQIIQSLKDGTCHIGMIPMAPPFQDDEQLKSFKHHADIKDQFQLIAPSSHVLVNVVEVLKKKQQKLLPIHINQQPMIFYEDESLTAEELEMDFKRLGIKPHIAMFLKSNQSVIEMVRKGLGISLMSQFLTKNQPGICALEIEGIFIERKIAVFTNPEIDLPFASKKFLEFLLSTVV